MVYAIVGAVILWKPFINTLGINVEDNIANATFAIRASLIYPAVGWIGCIYMGWHDLANYRHQMWLNAIGLPGTLLAILLFLSR